MADKSRRQAAHEAVGKYHEDQLAVLVGQVGVGIDRFRSGELDAFELDRILFQYSRAAKELWKFCNLGRPDDVLGLIAIQAPIDWWAVGAPKQR